MFSIIIPTFNKLDLTKKCLDAISSNSKGDFEVIVVDNASSDGTPDYLKKEKRIISTLNKKNLGFSKGNNIGAKKAKGETLVFLNNDTEVQKGWLESIEKVFEKEKNVGAVGVKLLFPDGLIQHAGVTFSEDHVPRHIYYREKADDPKVNKQREFKAVTAACIAIPKKVFEEVGGFDESFVNGLEDVDLCLRIKEKGYRILYTPESVVLHHESVSPGRFNANKHNSDLYMSRWRDVEPDEHRFYKEDGLGWWQILMKDFVNMGYSKDEYHTMPRMIKFGRYFYMPLQKIFLILKLLITLDFKTLGQKIRKVL
jgi:GT2 family glycosyltransferase